MSRPSRASETDACPGALRLHHAADGPLARVRLPGGMLTGAQLGTLGDIAAEWGDGGLELTSRANVQLRALTRAGPATLAARLSAAGLLPSPTHETVRNIAAPALADPTARGLVGALDLALCADPALAALPGRFLFAIGRVPLTADVAAFPTSPGHPAIPAADRGGDSAVSSVDSFVITFAGRDEGLRVPAERVVEALLAGAHAFLTVRAAAGVSAWRLAEIPDGSRRVAAEVATTLGVPLGRPGISEVSACDRATATPGGLAAGGAGLDAPVGFVAQGDGLHAVAAIVPLGRLTGVHVGVLRDAPRVTVTASRGVVIPDLTPEAAAGWRDALAGAGLAVAADSRWVGVTACAGRPGCAKSLADVRSDALAATRFAEGLPVHWVGCARGCGAPAGSHVRVEATPGGYAISRAGMPRPAGDATDSRRLAEAIAAARRS